MTEPPRPPGEGYPGHHDPTAPLPPSYSTPPPADGSSGGGTYPPPSSGAGAYPPPSSGAGAYPPPSSGAGAYPPPSSGAGAYPPPSSGAGAYPPPSSGAGAYPPPDGGAGAYPPPAGGYGPPPGGGYGAPPGGGYAPPYGAQPGYPGGPKANYAGDEKTWVILAHIGGVLFGFLAPLIVMLVKGNESPTVRAHAVEALNFQITWGLAALASVVLAFCSFGLLFFLPGIVWVVVLVFGIMATVKVSDGEWYTYPMTWRVVK